MLCVGPRPLTVHMRTHLRLQGPLRRVLVQEIKLQGIHSLTQLVILAVSGRLKADLSIVGLQLFLVAPQGGRKRTRTPKADAGSGSKPVTPIKLPWWTRRLLSSLTLLARDISCHIQASIPGRYMALSPAPPGCPQARRHIRALRR